MGKKSRDKGGRFELFLEHALKAVFPDARKMGTQQARDQKYADVEGTPFRIQAKHWATLTYGDLVRAIRKEEADGKEHGDDRIAIAITKIDRQKDPLVSMTLRAFMQLVERHFWREPELADVIPIRDVPPDDTLCGGCQKHPAQAEHTCPFKTEIHNDYESTCNCCTVCEKDCLYDT